MDTRKYGEQITQLIRRVREWKYGEQITQFIKRVREWKYGEQIIQLIRRVREWKYGEQLTQFIKRVREWKYGEKIIQYLKRIHEQKYGEQIFHFIRSVWDRTKLVIAAGAGFLLFVLVLLIIFAASPPVATFEQAWMALSSARRAEAKIYAAALFQKAEQNWEKATRTWSAENKKWFFQRDFHKAHHLARAVKLQALQAESTAIATRDSLQFVSIASLAFVKQKVDEFKAHFYHVPVDAPLRRKFIAGELLMFESELAFLREEYQLSALKVKQAEVLVGSAGSDASKLLRAYLRQVPEWQRWAAETVVWSEQNDATAVIVDKMSRVCQVYVDGKKHVEYPIELGPRWIGHKRQRGDNATPEGHYYITKKKSLRQTKYYKALEIDYPNENDREQFFAAKARGELSRYAQIGGLIEIHGDGGKGVNWTSGCMALRNQDIDKVFELAEVGTRVTIVGSLKAQPTLGLNAIHFYKKNLNGVNLHPISSQ